MGRLTCHAVDDPACSCEPAGDGGDATGGGESGRLPKAFGEWQYDAGAEAPSTRCAESEPI